MLIAANPQNPFAGLIYGLTDFFLVPVVGTTGSLAADGAVLEIPTLIAMIVSAFLQWRSSGSSGPYSIRRPPLR